MSFTLSTCTFFLLVGCFFVDPDGDGLSSTDEESHGTDPDRADTDGDGLDDYAEVNVWGTNPTSADTDGDGGTDGQEVDLGLDPINPASHPYTLGWPMLPEADKDLLMQGPSPIVAEVGKRLMRAHVYDKAAEAVDIYDYAGKPTVIMMIVRNELEIEIPTLPTWIETGEYPYTPSIWVRDVAFEGQINLIGVALTTTEDSSVPPILSDLDIWCDFDHPEIGCFADLSWELYSHVNRPVASAWLLLDENMIVRSFIYDPDFVGDIAFTDLEEKLAIMLNITPP
jgi:hypothetical protein